MVFEFCNFDKDCILFYDIFGGVEVFENVVRFLYGKSVLLMFINVVVFCCVVEYLEMNDSLGDGSLVVKIEYYLNFVVVFLWNDFIVVLCLCLDFKLWVEEFEIVCRCSEFVVWKVSMNLYGFCLLYFNFGGRDVVCGWWFDDVCNFYIDIFSSVINVMILKGVDFMMVIVVVV